MTYRQTFNLKMTYILVLQVTKFREDWLNSLRYLAKTLRGPLIQCSQVGLGNLRQLLNSRPKEKQSHTQHDQGTYKISKEARQ